MLIALHIVQEAPGPQAEGASATNQEPSQLVAELRHLVGEASEQGLNVALKIANRVDSQPAHGIADIAREVGADVIVVGTRGRSPIAGALVGSVTQHLLHLAPCPVLAVPPLAESSTDASDADVARATA
jgi:nucleotide-binding universal stress UspA family protein